MVQLSSNETYIALGVGAFFVVGVVGKRAGWFKIISGTNALMKSNIAQLETNNTLLKEQIIQLKAQLKMAVETHERDKSDWAKRHQESLVEIAKLQGKVDNLTVIPLKTIDESLKELVKSTQENADTNKAVLEQLQQTASINAEDRDVLTNQNKHIRTEVHKVMEQDVDAKK